MISIIVAQDTNRVIGKDNDLPWHLPNDLKRFKQLTTDHPVIMGRKTFQSIVGRIGHPLPDRDNIVVSSTLEDVEGVTIATSLDDALSYTLPEEEVFVIGGSRLFNEALERADRIYLTQVDAEVDGDTYFPELDPSEWHTLNIEDHKADERHAYNYQFIILERG